MTKYLLTLISLCACAANAQKLPAVNVNHVYVVIDSADLSALQHSEFFNRQFAYAETHSTKANGNDHWTGTYVQGLDNYLEIFNDKGFTDPLGYSGIGFSVDGIGEIGQLNAIISKKIPTDTLLRIKQMDDGRKVPWFNSISVKNPHFDSVTHMSFWVMEYKPEYFDYYHWPHTANQLTRVAYLDHFAAQRKDRLLKHFTGATFKLTDEERTVFAAFLAACGYQKTGENTYHSPENFIIRLTQRRPGDRSALASLNFDTSTAKTGTVKMSPHIAIQFSGKKGTMTFK